jgi:hypothetical protein
MTAATARGPRQHFMRRKEELGALQSQDNKILLPAAFSPLK